MIGARPDRLSRRLLLRSAAAQLTALAAGAALGQARREGGRPNMRFDRDRFVEDCVAASREGDAQAAVREVLARAVSAPGDVLEGLGTPLRAGLDVLLRSPTLTIFAAHWAPRMSLPTHDHRMWALIGIYTGREDNIFWHRTPGGVEAGTAKVLFASDVAALPMDAVHSVTNPLPRFTGGIHIYGGDFFDTPRSQWNPETLAEEPSDGAAVLALFERENERLRQEGYAEP
jgi:predicted metal-dependent enzyme (double-stranded beta helix superfamily)